MLYTVPKLTDFSAATLADAKKAFELALESEKDAVESENDWKAFKDRWMARKNGILTQINDKWLKAAPGPTKRDVGQLVNALRLLVEDRVPKAQGNFDTFEDVVGHPTPRGSVDEVIALKKKRTALGASVDITLPGIRRPIGAEHPVMQKMKPPVRVVCPGKVHRNDAADATHSPIFHQVEGLAVDTNITFCDLKGTLDHAMKALFGSSVKTRFYPSFFPFTEPSADMQVSCIFCGGKGCRKCKFSGWIELLGCGMVDPNVFDFVKQNGYDSSKISGFAFGMGVERIAILKYEVEEIQLFYEGDVRFLEQFA